jgi:hypothetical protein
MKFFSILFLHPIFSILFLHPTITYNNIRQSIQLIINIQLYILKNKK